MTPVKMFPTTPSAAPYQAQLNFSGTVTQASDGTLTVDSRDVPDCERMGFAVINTASLQASFVSGTAATPGPAALNQDLLFSSAALSNQTMAIAAQPDYPRKVQCVVFP